MSRLTVRVRRVYDSPDRTDGTRVLVDRVWPRGVRKDQIEMDAWMRELAPSTELRKWYGHDPERFDEFRQRYRAELDGDEAKEALKRLRATAGSTLTLLTATKDVDHSNAAVLAELLR